MIAWTDAHNHLQDSRLGEVATVLRGMKQAGVTECVANATREADWAAVAAVAGSDPDFVFPAFGVHPWHSHTVTDGWLGRLESLLKKHPRSSIGECGLDQWIAQPDLGQQMPVFTGQLELGRQMDRTVTIHCLKAWNALFEAFNATPPPQRFLMHSFGGSIEIARRLIPLGAYFSFSGYFLHPRKSAVLEVFRKLPRERILLETDAPDMLPPREFITHFLPQDQNHPANLPSIGERLAAALAMPPAELAELTRENTRKCFGI